MLLQRYSCVISSVKLHQKSTHVFGLQQEKGAPKKEENFSADSDSKILLFFETQAACREIAIIKAEFRINILSRMLKRLRIKDQRSVRWACKSSAEAKNVSRDLLWLTLCPQAADSSHGLTVSHGPWLMTGGHRFNDRWLSSIISQRWNDNPYQMTKKQVRCSSLHQNVWWTNPSVLVKESCHTAAAAVCLSSRRSCNMVKRSLYQKVFHKRPPNRNSNSKCH